MHFVVFNGPPGSGKSTAAPLLVSFLRDKQINAVQDSFANPMKHFISVLLGQKYYQIKKDEAHVALNNRTPRQFLIDLSENYMKPTYGSDVFGRTLYNRSIGLNAPPDFVICDDGGFDAEYNALGEHTNRFLVRISRPGKDYSNDSRGYLSDPDWYLNNDLTLDDLRGNVYALANELILIHRGELRRD